MYVCVCVKLIADAKLTYDLDLKSIGPKLLAVKDKVVSESSGRHKSHAQIMDKFARHMEETLSDEMQQGTGL